MAVAIVIVLGSVASLFVLDLDESNSAIVTTVLLAVALVTTLGFIEDVRGISVRNRLIYQLLLSGAVASSMLYLADESLLWTLPLSFVGMFLINTANFMDGINGISSFHGILLGATALVSGIMASNGALIVLGVVVGIAFLGFLPWNFPRAQMFLGDSGSYLVGGLFFTIGFWVYAETGSPFLALAPGAYYIFDVIFTLIVRKFQGENLTEAHRDHLYQRFQRRLESHTAATLATAALTTLIILAAIAESYALIPMPLALSLALGLLFSTTMTFGDRKVSA